MCIRDSPPIDQNGIITGYQLSYEPLTGVRGAVSLNLSALSSGITLSGLDEFVSYNISVRAFTSVGPGPYSIPLTRVTDEDCKFVKVAEK